MPLDEIPGAGPDHVLHWIRYYWPDHFGEPADQLLLHVSLMRLDQLVTERIKSVVKPLDLTPRTYAFMMALFLVDGGAQVLARLSSTMLVHPTTASLVANQLERRGFVTRDPHPSDRRATCCAMTAAGRLMTERATELLVESQFGFSGVSKSVLKRLVQGLGPVRRALLLSGVQPDNRRAKSPASIEDPVEVGKARWEMVIDAPVGAHLAMSSVAATDQLLAWALERELKRVALNRTSYVFLMTLLLSETGARTMTRISDYLAVHPTTVTLVADQLEKRDLVAREPHPTDRRVTLCRATELGGKVATEVTTELLAQQFGLAGVGEDLTRIIDQITSVTAAIAGS